MAKIQPNPRQGILFQHDSTGTAHMSAGNYVERHPNKQVFCVDYEGRSKVMSITEFKKHDFNDEASITHTIL
jgi:hypothetical protein